MRSLPPPDGRDLLPDWRAPELVWGGVASLAVTILIAAAWAILAGTEDERLDDLGIFTGMAAGLPAAGGAVASALRAPGHREAGAVLVRTGYGLITILGAAAAQLVLLLVLTSAGELVWVGVGGLLGCLAVALLGSLLALLIGGSVLWATRMPPGSGLLQRSLMGLMLLSVLSLGVGGTLGSTASLRTGDIVGLIAILLGLSGEVESTFWLWVARASAVALLVLLIAITRTLRRGTVPTPDQFQG